MAQETTDFMTVASILTFSGATTATWVVTALAGKIINRNSPLLSAVIACGVSFLIAQHVGLLNNALEWALVVVNGGLLFFSASGLNEGAVALATSKPAGETETQGREKTKFLRSWFN